MNRFRKKSETRRPQVLDDPKLFDLSRSSSASTSNSSFQISGNTGGNNPPTSASSTAAPPALPALSTGLEFRTSLVFPDLTRSFQQTGRPAHIPEAKIRSKLAQQRLHGIHEERITEEEEDLMFAALSSIQGMRRARGNSSASANNSTISSGNASANMSTGDASVELLYPESVGSGGSIRSPGMSSAGLIGSFPETPVVGGNGEGSGSASASGSIYPFASLSPHLAPSSNVSPRRHSNNLFGSSRFRDASYMKGIQRNRTISGSTNATNTSNSTAAITISSDVFEESSSPSPSPSPSPIEPNSNASTAYISHQYQGYGHFSDKEKTPVARSTRLPLPQPPTVSVPASPPRLPNGTTLTAAKLRRISVALDRAISAIVENEHEADDDEERILAPHSVPLGGGYPARVRPPTAFNDPSNPIEVSDLNAVLMFLESSRQSQSQSIHSLTQTREPSTSSPSPVSSTPTPGYVPGMNRPISPRDMSNSGHDSEDYSTTPRATSPVTLFNRGGVLAPRKQNGNVSGNSNSGRPSTAPTRIGMNTGSSAAASTSDWRGQYHQQRGTETSSNTVGSGLDRSHSVGQPYDRRFQSQAGDLGSNGVNHHIIAGYTHRRRPSSPLAHEHFTAASGVNGANTSLTGAATALSISMGSAASANTSTDSGSDTQVNFVRPVGAQGTGNAPKAPEPPTSASEADRGVEIVNGQGLSREKSPTSLMTGPSLPDSPMIDEDPFRNHFPIPPMHNWAQNLERQASGGSSSTVTGNSVGGIVMPQPTQRMPVPASSVPVITRSQTPNNIARTTTPVAASVTIPTVAMQTSPIGRVGTPNYLVQRSPSANGFNMDYGHDGVNATQDGSVRRTLSHTPSTSSTSAYNPMLHSSLGSSSRSSTGSAGSSYHSSDEGDTRFREVSNWLFDPESKGSTFVSGKRKAGINGDGDDSSRDDMDSKDDASDSIGDQEDVLQLLTGLTKRDLSSIQQKLVSAAVAREAEDAIRLSQRRRRPSVQSREFVGSSTPKPQTTTQLEPVIIQRVTSPAPVIINRIQSPAPEARPEPENIVLPEVLPEPPMIIARPLSPVEEPPVEYTITEEFEVPSAATTPPLAEAQISVTPPIDQSPRAKALAEALFGGETLSPAISPPRLNRSAEELHDEVERKVIAATTALKNPTLTVEGGSPLRRKSTKRIDLQKISGPHLVSASMSVDAIPLASPSMTSLGVTMPPQDGAKRGSGIGSRLRRLGGSLRTKTNTTGHERDHPGSGNVVQEPTSSGLSQVVDYYPQGLQPPQIRSVPPHGGDSVKGAVGSPGPITPPATAGPAGLKGFITRLRRPGGGSIRRGETSPGRPAVSMQPSAFLSSPHLNENESVAPISRAQPAPIRVLARAPPSDSLSVPPASTSTPDETSLKQLFDAASNLGLDPAALNELLSQRAASQASKAAPWMTPADSRPGTSTQRYEDSSGSSWTTAQTSAAPSRQASTRVKIEAAPRLRPAREGGNPPSAVVRRTIIYPSTSAGATSASPLPGQTRSTGVQRKGSTTSSNNKRRPISYQSQYSGKSVHDRTPTPPPPRGAAAKRMSQDGMPPMPGSMFSPNGHPGTSAGIINDGNGDSHSIDLHEGSPDLSNLEDGRALQLIELENGEVIWSVLDSLRAPGDDLEDDVRSNYFSNRGSFASHYSGVEDPLQVSTRGLGRSTSRAGTAPNNGSLKGVPDGNRPETKVFYSDAKEIARIIGQITNAADYGQFNVNPETPSTRSSEDLPVEDQLERLMQRLAETR